MVNYALEWQQPIELKDHIETKEPQSCGNKTLDQSMLPFSTTRTALTTLFGKMKEHSLNLNNHLRFGWSDYLTTDSPLKVDGVF